MEQIEGKMNGMLTAGEIGTARRALETALRLGAQKVRITLSKSLMDLIGTLNGEIDKVNRCLDKSMSFCLFVDGRFGTFSTNRLKDDEIEAFLANAVEIVRMLAEDRFRDLPDPSRTAKAAKDGRELELCDPAYSKMDAERRLQLATEASIFKKHEGENLISEEGEYSDSILDLMIIDSQGLECRHTETAFEYGVEVTVLDPEGNRYSGYWWDSSPKFEGLDLKNCGETALRRARAQIGHRRIESGKYTMVVDNENSSRLVSPLMKALGGYAIQQNNSFLLESLGKQVLPPWLDIIDEPESVGEAGSRLFDSEGVAVRERPVVEKGVVREYFLTTYIAAKLGMEPTCDDIQRPHLLPCHAPHFPAPAKYDLEGIMEKAGEGILVTGFNGGNSNSATGNFSFGVEGFYFKEGKIVHPVREMLITGNLLTLWNSLAAAGDDARACKSKLIPTLAFENVDFSA
ncbi:MAG: TldD/PmbA family protein [Candidatus Cryptobacteroides sp.]